MSKKILIVTGSDYTKPVYKAFEDVKAMGHNLYLLSDGSFEPKEGVFEKHFTYDLRKTAQVLDYMKSQNINFDAVTIKTSEWLTPLVALLAKEYKCIGNEPQVAFNCRSKYHMRQKMAAGGVPIPKFKLCRNYEEVLKAAEEIGMPCVAKPVGGNASYGTFIIRDKKDIDENYQTSIEYLKKKAVSDDIFAFSKEEMDLMGLEEKVDMVTDYLVEQYMIGPQISVDALVQNGRAHIIAIEEQIRMEAPYFLQLKARMPYISPEKQAQEIQEIIQKTVQALDIKNSATHTEIKFTEQGPKIVEIACRIGGDDIHDAAYESTGVNLMFESIMIALGAKREYKVETKFHTTGEYIFPKQKGDIKKLHVSEDLKSNPNVCYLDLNCEEGLKVDLPPHSFDFLGYISAKGETPQKAEANLQEALQMIKIEIS